MPVQIHGKEYQTVAERLNKAHEDKKLLSVETEVLNHDPIVIRAKIDMGGQVFTGISSVAKDSIKQIEKSNPYEVAETSAVGRALAFAGYGGVDSIASAEEMVKSMATEKGATRHEVDPDEEFLNQMDQESDEPKTSVCATCGAKATLKSGDTNGKHWTGLFCSSGDRTHTKWG